MKQRKWQYLVGLLCFALFNYFIFFADIEQRKWLGSKWQIIIIVGILWFIIGSIYFRRRRKGDLKEFGAGMGLFSSPQEDYPAFSKKIDWSNLLAWSPIKESRFPKIRHLMQGNIDVADVAIFDRVITQKGGEDLVTAVLFESDQLSLPSFLLCPEGVLDKMASALGDQDIDFDEFPKFSRQYLLRGPEEQVRNVFNSNVLSYFDNDPGWTLEGFGTQLLVYRVGKRVASKEEFQEFQQRARMIFQLFQ
jgi:hypothetical protein